MGTYVREAAPLRDQELVGALALDDLNRAWRAYARAKLLKWIIIGAFLAFVVCAVLAEIADQPSDLSDYSRVAGGFFICIFALGVLFALLRAIWRGWGRLARRFRKNSNPP